MTSLPADGPLARTLERLLAPETTRPLAGEWTQEPLPSSRQVYRFTLNGNGRAAVAKLFGAYPPITPADQGLAREYDNYLQAAALGLDRGYPGLPKLLGRRPEVGLGLLLEAIPGPDLDSLLQGACLRGDLAALERGLENLAELLAFFHSRPLPETLVSDQEGLAYLDKVLLQLQRLGLLTSEDTAAFSEERAAWSDRLRKFPDRQVLVHGDATATNFLFPDNGGRGRPPYGAVAVDLARLRPADRLWDLSWLAGEIKHAWVWRTGHACGVEEAIGACFTAYLAAWPRRPELEERLYLLNPFYMALAELRIARNSYLSWDHCRWLVREARQCLACGRRL